MTTTHRENIMSDANTSNLTALYTDDTWAVDDADGGRWFPSDEAAEEIEAAADPASKAIEICARQPMRGTWKA